MPGKTLLSPPIIGKPSVHLLSSQACLQSQIILSPTPPKFLELQGFTEVSGTDNIHVRNWAQFSLIPERMADIVISELVQWKTENSPDHVSKK